MGQQGRIPNSYIFSLKLCDRKIEKIEKKKKKLPPVILQVEATEWCCGALRWLSVELALRLLAFTAAAGPSLSDWIPQHCRTAMQMPGGRRKGGGGAKGEGKAMMAWGLREKEDQLMCFCLCFLFLPSTSTGLHSHKLSMLSEDQRNLLPYMLFLMMLKAGNQSLSLLAGRGHFFFLFILLISVFFSTFSGYSCHIPHTTLLLPLTSPLCIIGLLVIHLDWLNFRKQYLICDIGYLDK